MPYRRYGWKNSHHRIRRPTAQGISGFPYRERLRDRLCAGAGRSSNSAGIFSVFGGYHRSSTQQTRVRRIGRYQADSRVIIADPRLYIGRAPKIDSSTSTSVAIGESAPAARNAMLGWYASVEK